MISDIEAPASWHRSAERVLREGYRRILVLGLSDRGKSTYCSWLSSTLDRAGCGIAFVDADIGQKDIGPPATVTLGYPASARPLEATAPSAMRFVGAVNPMGHFLPLVTAARDLADRAQADVVVIDTTGLVRGPGRQLKDQLIDAVRPDLLVAIARGGELDALLKANRHLPTLRLRPAKRARSKSEALRRGAREGRFRDYFDPARRITLDLRRVVVREIPLFSGHPEALEGCLWAETTPDGRVAVAPQGVVLPRKARRIEVGFERDRLCALGDGRDEMLGLGIVEAIDFDRLRIHLRTPVPRETVKTLRFGELLVQADGRHQCVPW